MIQQLDSIKLPPTPKPSGNNEEFKRNVENYCREVAQTVRQLESKLREVIDAVNTR